jgi:hypothetical protein
MCVDARCVPGGRGRVGCMSTNILYVAASFLIIAAYAAYFMLR